MSTFTYYPYSDNATSFSPMLTPTFSEDRISPRKYYLEPSLSHLNNHRLPTRNQFIWRRTKAILKASILLFLSIGYLAFCYTVNRHTVPLKHLGPFSITRDNLGTIKSAITTLNITIITLALYPAYDFLLVLRSEEFFHALIQKTQGMPLSTINAISTPVFGKIDALSAIITRQCSRFFVLATVGSLIVFLTSILAPTALSIQSVLADGDILALPVGAVANNSVYNTTFFTIYADETHVNDNVDFAASILWAEMELGVQYDFSVAASTEADILAFIVPQPLNLPMTSTARWLTDVIGLRPSCKWASTNITQPVIVPNKTDDLAVVGVYLEDMDLDVAVNQMDIFAFESFAAITVKDPILLSLNNHTTLKAPTDGSTVIIAAQCMSGCTVDPTYNTVWLNFTGIPTFTTQLPPAITFMGYQSWDLAFLVCKPNAVIETREVRAEGGARLSVQPLGEGNQLTSQGNLFPQDTTTMLSFALSGIQLVGPMNGSSLSGLGSQVQRHFLFGSQQVDSWPAAYTASGTNILNVSFLPEADLSAGFAQMLQSASKGYLTGYLGTAFVPARLSNFEVVFMSSLPLVTVSTATFFLLYILVGFLQFRKEGEEFNLPNIARIVHGSNLPGEVLRSVHDIDDGTGKQCSERDVIAKMGDRAVILQPRGDGSHLLQVT